jgi:hypothetical protein
MGTLQSSGFASIVFSCAFDYTIKKSGPIRRATADGIAMPMSSTVDNMTSHGFTKMKTSAKGCDAIGNDTIYILSGNTVYAANLDDDGKITSTWSECETNVTRLFDNQAETVYIVKDEKLFKIDDKTEINPTLVDGAEAKNVVAAVSLSGVDYFFGTTACAVSENNFYFASGAEIKYGNNPDSLKTVSTNFSATSMTIFENNIYVGTESGAFVAKINETSNSLNFSYLSGNAESAFGDREVLGIWKFDDKDNFFVSVTATSSSLYDALWGYDSSINKWNLE